MEIIQYLPKELQCHIIDFVPSPSISAIDSLLSYMRQTIYDNNTDTIFKIRPYNKRVIDTDNEINVCCIANGNSYIKNVFLITMKNSVDLLNRINFEHDDVSSTTWDDIEWNNFYEHVFLDTWYRRMYAVNIA